MVGDISSWDDQAVAAGMQSECAEMRALDSHFPARYHRLGTFINESTKRFGKENVKQVLRQEEIDNTKAWRAEQIATLYTFDQAVAFPSLRAILKTLPAKQPRKPKPKAVLTGGDDHQGGTPQEPTQVFSVAVTEETILDRFIQLGIKVRELLGDEALDQAVERIKSHVPETLEEVFAEV
jgi:ABC-type enterochelin transport system substrate-binding protein